MVKSQISSIFPLTVVLCITTFWERFVFKQGAKKSNVMSNIYKMHESDESNTSIYPTNSRFMKKYKNIQNWLNSLLCAYDILHFHTDIRKSANWDFYI